MSGVARRREASRDDRHPHRPTLQRRDDRPERQAPRPPAALERPLLLAGLALVALHLLDLAFSGPATSFLGVPTHPAAYERRTTAFLDRALGLKETS
jgi:hypothetical protein